MTAPARWERFTVSATLSVAMSIHAESEDQARRWIDSALQTVEIEPGYANGEQPRQEGGVDVVTGDALARLIAAARNRLSTVPADCDCGIQGCGVSDCRCVRDAAADAALTEALRPFAAVIG